MPRFARFLLFLVAFSSACRESGHQETAFAELFARVKASGATEFVFRDPVGTKELRQLSSLHTLEVIELHQGEFAVSTLASCLAEWPELRRLRVECCQVDDQVMEAVGRLQHLEVLNFPHGEFTDVGLRSVASLPNLFLLRFGSPNVTDAGLAHLVDSPALRFLHLLLVPITDDGLQAFHGMQQLESFYIDGGKESEDGIRALLKANSNLHFHRNQLHVAEDPNADGH